MDDLLLGEGLVFRSQWPQNEVEQLVDDAPLWIVRKQEAGVVVGGVHHADPGGALGVERLDLGDRVGEPEAAHELAVDVPVLKAQAGLPVAADRLHIGIGQGK